MNEAHGYVSRCRISVVAKCAGLALMLSGWGGLGVQQAQAQAYPNRLVRLVVPIVPGGTTDLVGRMLAQEMSRNTGRQFIVENRGGASGIIGTQAVARSAPDGYTLLLTTATHTINPSLYRKLPYDAMADFSAVSLMASSPMVIVVHPSLPVRSVAAFIALTKKSDRPLNYGSAGTGTPSHLVVELFQSMTGANLQHIPYKGGAPSTADLVSGQIELKVSAILPVLPFIQAGKARALGVTSIARVAMLPDVPTVAESGVRGFEFGLWYVMLAPAGVSPVISEFLSAEVRKALQSDAIKPKVEADGGTILATTPAVATAHLKKEMERYQALVRSAGIPVTDL